MKYPRSFLALFVLAFQALSAPAQAGPAVKVRDFFYPNSLALRLYVHVVEPADRPPLANVLFLHGLGDCSENHPILFAEWLRQGYRVISFDFPGHGKTQGMYNTLNLYGFTELAEMAIKVLNYVETDENTPLILAGWSTGGLLALRMVQSDHLKHFKTTPSALVLIAPAISAQTFPGNAGVITTETLTRNPLPPHACEISPKVPMLSPRFATKLMWNGLLARAPNSELPADIPTIVFLGGSETDRYINTTTVRAWLTEQQNKNQADVSIFNCEGGFHELDNEPGQMGQEVRTLAGLFPRAVLGRDLNAKWDDSHFPKWNVPLPSVCHFIFNIPAEAKNER